MSTYPKTQGGYTLIELLVALGLFAIVMLTATAAYLSFINYNRLAQTSSAVVNSLSFTIDTMAREIRTGTAFSCESTCSLSGVDWLRFTSAEGCTVTYEQSGTSILRTESGASPCVSASNVAVTDSTITIETLRFYVRGTSTSDQQQPMATIVVSGYAVVPNSTVEVPFNIQTGATMRVPDL